ncbi:MAG: hypothetical protein OCC46_10520 [Pseudodesulfovibrio sp.]
MKKFIIAALKILLLLLLFIAAAVGCYALVVYMAWPWWAAASLYGGLIGGVVAILFIRKWLLRRREKRFVKRIIDHDASSIAAAPSHERHRLQELQDRWKEAVEILRTSELRKRGNPLYVLPWYMVFGESDSGKSTAVASSRLTSIITDVGPMPGVSATKNCDWWFFEEAIILDTAGRYAIPLDESRDKEEWERFLTLLVKFRKKEPLNGLIVTVPADRLLAGDDDDLTEYGRSIRRRVDELMRVLGARFPVYVLVTKMDLVFGLSGLTEVLPEYARSQAMGLVNEAMMADPEDFVDKVILSVTDRLRELRLLLLDGASQFDPAFLLFSDELERLRPRLKAFSMGTFEDNPYQEAPLYRGLFFSSGEQTGEFSSEFLSDLSSLAGVDKRLPNTAQGLFLHDFFSKVLPRDRNLFTPILEFLKWKLLTRNLGMAAWLLGLFFACGLLSLSYLGNVRAMDQLFKDFPQKPEFSEELDLKIVELASFREHILELEKMNSDWWIPRMGLDVSLDAQDNVEDFYCWKFKTLFLDPVDRDLNVAIGKLNAKSPEALTSQFVRLLVWRIDMIENRLAGADLETLESFQLPEGDILAQVVPGFSSDMMGYVKQMYSSYLLWTDKTIVLEEELLLLKARLGKVLSLKGADFKWLVDWANENPVLHDVTLRDFWGGPLMPVGHEVHVKSAFTTAGRKSLEMFLGELKSAVDHTGNFDKQEKQFWSWYAGQYYNAWFEFSDQFIQGEGQLLTKRDYRNMATRMSTVNNPYFNLLTRMNDEFLPLKDMRTPPSWVSQVFHFNVVMTQYKESQQEGVEEVSENAKASLRKVVADLGGKLAKDIGRHIKAAKKLDAYMSVLDDIAAYTASQEDAFKSASVFYPGGTSSGGSSGGTGKGGKAASGKTPIDTAMQSIINLKGILGLKGQGEQMFWDLVSGPLDYMVYVITQEASCELQQLWEGQVLAEVAHVPSNKLREKLFGKSGVVDKFTSGPAKPFLSRSAKSWGGRSWYNIPFPFTDEFYSFLNEGSRGSQEIQPQYKVTLSTIPTTVNAEATEEPYATLLELECGSEQQVLANFNYAESEVFTWKPDECGTTVLSIQFPGIQLSRTYEGKLGFAKFLQEFRQGSVTFTAKDFPDQAKGLKGLGVTSIKVGYTFKGASPVAKILQIKPINIPETISDCWQQ